MPFGPQGASASLSRQWFDFCFDERAIFSGAIDRFSTPAKWLVLDNLNAPLSHQPRSLRAINRLPSFDKAKPERPPKPCAELDKLSPPLYNSFPYFVLVGRKVDRLICLLETLICSAELYWGKLVEMASVRPANLRVRTYFATPTGPYALNWQNAFNGQNAFYGQNAGLLAYCFDLQRVLLTFQSSPRLILQHQ